MDITDINRATHYNKQWFTKFKWIKPFVDSEILKCKVAIAQLGDDMFLINNSGEFITVIDNI